LKTPQTTRQLLKPIKIKAKEICIKHASSLHFFLLGSFSLLLHQQKRKGMKNILYTIRNYY